MLSPALVHRAKAIWLHDGAVKSRCKVIGLALHWPRSSREMVRGSLDETRISKEAEVPSDSGRRCTQLSSDFAAR